LPQREGLRTDLVFERASRLGLEQSLFDVRIERGNRRRTLFEFDLRRPALVASRVLREAQPRDVGPTLPFPAQSVPRIERGPPRARRFGRLEARVEFGVAPRHVGFVERHRIENSARHAALPIQRARNFA
jgi:hypothetical protein